MMHGRACDCPVHIPLDEILRRMREALTPRTESDRGAEDGGEDE